MKKSDLLRELQIEIRRHAFDTFVDEPPSMAQAGKGVVYAGCPACRKKLFTVAQFIDHLPSRWKAQNRRAATTRWKFSASYQLGYKRQTPCCIRGPKTRNGQNG